ncbi:TAXI family TRAP transporter solute-binding subunit [soil metagenome]
MTRQRAVATGLATILAGSFAAGEGLAQEQNFVSVGTGGVTGVYYPVGGSVCRLMNQTRREHGIRCSVESTGGSVFNINAMLAGDLEFGVVQSDVQFNAYNGAADWEGEPFEDLRAVFALHPEPLTLVARAESDIEHLDDLPGNRVNIGNPGSGQRALFETLMEEKGWDMGTFSLASELASAEQSQALCDNNIDVFAFTVGHPAGTIQEATTTCDTRIIPATGEAVEALLEEYPYYFAATIPGGMYRGTDEDVETFGVGATIVTRADVDEETVYIFVQSVFEDFETFRGLHPSLANLEPETMASVGLSAPLHPGAERYYQEQGWLDAE